MPTSSMQASIRFSCWPHAILHELLADWVPCYGRVAPQVQQLVPRWFPGCPRNPNLSPVPELRNQVLGNNYDLASDKRSKASELDPSHCASEMPERSTSLLAA